MNYKNHIEIMEDIQERMGRIDLVPSEDSIRTLSDDVETLASTMAAILEKLQEIEQTADKASNTASCLANGIQPD